MTKAKIRLRSLLTIWVAVLFAASMPAFAEHGSNGSSGSGDSTTSSTSSTTTVASGDSGGTSDQTKTTAEVEAENTSGDTGHTELHHQGASLLAEMEKQHKANQTEQERQNKCESHKQGLETKFKAIVTNSQRIQNKIDGILSQAETYKTTNNLDPANWDTLDVEAHTAQSASNAAIAALKDVTPTLNCNNVSVASDVATFKAAAQTARDKLKTYRDAVKALLQALEAVKPTTSTGSNQ